MRRREARADRPSGLTVTAVCDGANQLIAIPMEAPTHAQTRRVNELNSGSLGKSYGTRKTSLEKNSPRRSAPNITLDRGERVEAGGR